MIWIGIFLLSAVVLLPSLLAFRRTTRLRDERESAMLLHRAQLAELDRDRESGLIADGEHAGARLEIQRRLLASDAASARGLGRSVTTPVVMACLLLLPLTATGLYLLCGHPTLPAQPLAPRLAAQKAQDRRDDALLAELRAGLARMSPDDPNRFQGFLLLGQAEAARDHYAAAAEAWRQAMTIRFIPEIAVRAAEAQTLADGRVSPESAALFRRALDAAPADAPWRMAAQQRIAQSEHQ
ncbi:cytochrome c-type biogenesis protein CycH [Gluconacetobacter sacchari DSM 12717]|uniref:C-type cytochrome biogenesis protein CcmI n=2 Tax=Gluconacetobacter sacchari TaxID=92759 RepID=A0A7W4IB84_9PROT|nr:c-type cytochrome biogenesis protein CcmI [Gluconacetobacter sacchari]MBB2159623.1 c-type cytochrome biogenesis protein CcmI [Gluconacetobacter sacchari]GBQ25123.1 cytochrome c-type biogenesis protein CycH [Gluconacetobacter sacchari DSM 12717]